MPEISPTRSPEPINRLSDLILVLRPGRREPLRKHPDDLFDGGTLTVSNTKPSSPGAGNWWLVSAAISSGLTGVFDSDGSTALTALAKGDLLEYSASSPTGWVRRYQGLGVDSGPPYDDTALRALLTEVQEAISAEQHKTAEISFYDHESWDTVANAAAGAVFFATPGSYPELDALPSQTWTRTGNTSTAGGNQKRLYLRLPENANPNAYRVTIGSSEHRQGRWHGILTHLSYSYYYWPSRITVSNNVAYKVEVTTEEHHTQWDGRVPVDASGFGTNLQTTDDTLQKVADRVDQLSLDGGVSDYDDLANKPVLSGVGAASAATVGKLVLNGDDAELTRETVHHQQTAATATWADYSNTNYLGAFNTDPNPVGVSAGRWYFNIPHKRPRLINTVGPIASWTDAGIGAVISGASYIGEFANDAEATLHASAVGNVYWDTTTEKLRRASAFTAASGSETKTQEFLRVATAEDVAHLQSQIADRHTEADVDARIESLAVTKDDRPWKDIYILPGAIAGDVASLSQNFYLIIEDKLTSKTANRVALTFAGTQVYLNTTEGSPDQAAIEAFGQLNAIGTVFRFSLISTVRENIANNLQSHFAANMNLTITFTDGSTHIERIGIVADSARFASPATTGLNQAAVDARVAAGVQDWAEAGNNSPIPASKLTNAASGGTGFQAGDITDVTYSTRPANGFKWVATGYTVPSSVDDDDYILISVEAGDWADPGSFVRTSGTTGFVSVKQWRALAADVATNNAQDGEFLTIDFANAPNSSGNLNVGRTSANEILFCTTNSTLFWNNARIRIVSDAGGSAPGGGQTAQQVRDAIAAGVKDYAETGNTDGIAKSDLASALQTELDAKRTEAQVDARVAAGVQDWAEAGNNEAIPASKLSNAPGGTPADDSILPQHLQADSEEQKRRFTERLAARPIPILWYGDADPLVAGGASRLPVQINGSVLGYDASNRWLRLNTASNVASDVTAGLGLTADPSIPFTFGVGGTVQVNTAQGSGYPQHSFSIYIGGSNVPLRANPTDLAGARNDLRGALTINMIFSNLATWSSPRSLSGVEIRYVTTEGTPTWRNGGVGYRWLSDERLPVDTDIRFFVTMERKRISLWLAHGAWTEKVLDDIDVSDWAPAGDFNGFLAYQNRTQFRLRNYYVSSPLEVAKLTGFEPHIGGVTPITQGGTGANTAALARQSLGLGALATLSNVAANLITGVLDAARIPNLNASKITAGEFSVARIPGLAASKITSGVLNAARIPGLAASKITSGIIAAARLGTGSPSASTVLHGDSVWRALTAAGVNVPAWTSGLNPAVGDLVRHGSSNTVFMCIQAVPSGSRTSGPDGLPANYLQLNTFIGDWQAAWYQPGSYCLRAISGESGKRAYVALEAIVRGDAAPESSAKWRRVDSENLPASAIVSGTFNAARIPDLNASKITAGILAVARIPGLAASKITSGILPIARGGTGASSAAAARTALGISGGIQLTAETEHDAFPGASSRAILTSVIPPSSCDIIRIQFRRGNTSSDHRGWTSIYEIPYSAWNALAEVTTTTAISESNGWHLAAQTQQHVPEWFVCKGTGGVLAFASGSIADGRRFNKIRVSYITLSS